MRISRLAWIATVSAIALSPAAFAADSGTDADSKSGLTQGDGWYFSGSTGLSLMENSTSRGAGGHFDTSADPGFAVNGAVGKEFGNGFRAEGELGYRQLSLDHVTSYGGGLGSGGAGGDAEAFSVMGNGYYDFDTGGPIKPYIGAGLGFAQVSLSNATVNGRSLVDDEDLVFAYQAMAGVGYQVNPKGTLFLGYRYFAVDDPSFNSAIGPVQSEMATHNVEVGYRLAF